MQTPSERPARQLLIQSEYDVVVVRYAVRQAARQIGLGLGQQAKIATAVSTIARALLEAAWTATVHIRAAASAQLEIACCLSGQPAPDDLAGLEATLNLASARSLVDEASLQHDEHGRLQLLLRANHMPS